MSDNDNFFESRTAASKIKSNIIHDYFKTWVRIIRGAQKRKSWATQKVGYIDMFAGPGYYDDGSKSTPILVMEHILEDEDYTKSVVSYFNDKSKESVDKLKENISGLEGHEKLKYKPTIGNDEVDAEELADFMDNSSLIPTLCLFDPWGYKGLTLDLIDSVLSNWGSDCIFFFNYKRINAAINNDVVRPHMDKLFGSANVDTMRKIFNEPLTTPKRREALIIETLAQALRSKSTNKDRYVLAFHFNVPGQDRTSHHIIFTTGSFKGYEVMKDIMHKHSNKKGEGTAGFGFDDKIGGQLQILDGMSMSLSQLEDAILEAYSGQTTTRNKIYQEHSIGNPFLKKHYNQALKSLEKKGILAVPSHYSDGKKRRVGDYPDRCKITFP